MALSTCQDSSNSVHNNSPFAELNAFSVENCKFIEKHRHEKESAKHDLQIQIADTLLVSGLYWGLNTQSILEVEALEPKWCAQQVLDCQTESGAFAGSQGHDAHVLYTYSALQVLVLCGYPLSDVPLKEELIKWISALQNEDGSFSGDEFGSADSRFSYCALACLALLNELRSVNVPRAVSYILSCKSVDGGFGMQPCSEAHAGQTFCCIASLSICGALHHVLSDQSLSYWLSERQNADGGMNGRPGKKSDTCYSWWVGASCCILEKEQLLNWGTLASFIINHQSRQGGISAHLGDEPDLFHTHFAVAALALCPTIHEVPMGSGSSAHRENQRYSTETTRDRKGDAPQSINAAPKIHPVFCLPATVVDLILQS
eukprot:m.1425605 g.1425605  ORF g.1425605 m.1425605 type:complete len:373 (+) comp25064_c0_seq34:223-1341(+)